MFAAILVISHPNTQAMKILIKILMFACVLPAMAQVKVGVFLPFKSGGAIGESAVEYYRGLLMAVDSLSQGGQQFTVTAAHSGQTTQREPEWGVRYYLCPLQSGTAEDCQ